MIHSFLRFVRWYFFFFVVMHTQAGNIRERSEPVCSCQLRFVICVMRQNSVYYMWAQCTEINVSACAFNPDNNLAAKHWILLSLRSLHGSTVSVEAHTRDAV